MKLLICTQVVDKKHPVLGFFHRWIVEFAKHFEYVHVICLQEGEHTLPANVQIHSLGKEKGVSRLKYLIRLYRYIWRLRKDYDAVFVHMNQEYFLLAGALWSLLNKKMSLWRNHYSGNFLTDIACIFPDNIFYTSNSSYTRKFKKSFSMPIGIDTVFFKPIDSLRTQNILYVGRISESKRIQELLIGFRGFVKSPNYAGQRLRLVGSAITKEDKLYSKKLHSYTQKLHLPVDFLGPVTWSELPKIYSAHALCINLSPPGMFDKVLGEALACGCRVLTTNADLKEPRAQVTFIEDSDLEEEVLSRDINRALKQDFDQNSARQYIVECQSLHKTVNLVKKYYVNS